ncbi:YafY family protein [Demequina sp. NBRC 110053]|uniref:helix-turn-helix transcriptional regulator n=1 Tax=Demequina sp. NBRC 110053 TaxID=1570342 RepID=UPI000A057F3E|nr:WYL domain-containing protein [Demequina sp. NBRC 110053]
MAAADGEIDPAQRLLNLMLALSRTRHRLTRDQIRASVEGYETAPAGVSEAERGRADASFERMFERDKKALRSMGIPLRTITDPAHQDDLGYRIDPDVDMPPLDLTVQDAAILAIAAQYWTSKAMKADARQGYAKLVSAVEHEDGPALPFGGVSTSGSADVVAALAEAASLRQVVSFEYASASSPTRVRTVEPWGIVLRSGVEYLVGWDVDAAAERVFRLVRVQGKVKPRGEPEAFDRPATLPLGSLADDADVATATIAVRPEAGHALRRRGEVVGADDGWDVLEVSYRHADLLRAEVLALAGAARVIEPADLARSVREHALAAAEVARG